MCVYCTLYNVHRRLWRVRAGMGPGHEPRGMAAKRPGSELGLGAGDYVGSQGGTGPGSQPGVRAETGLWPKVYVWGRHETGAEP